MTFEPENRLEDALLKAKTDVLARPVFYQLLMTEALIVAGDVDRTPGKEGINLAVLKHNGREFHPIFSSLTRLRAIAPGEKRHFLAVGRDLFLRTKGADFALNPSSELGKVLMANEIAFWLDPSARARRTLVRNQPHAVITIPQERPRKLVEALSILFVNRHDIVSAQLLDVQFSDRNEPPHPLIVIETEGDWAKLSGEISALTAAVMPDMIVDIIPLDRAARDPQFEGPLASAPPFFQRKPSE